ncbi:class I SAM-dependent methyltransferase [Mesorhizobium sp. J428]|uniref:class I SAM-dependent methyltransferase n=1 Tax=Mesorhizobium sp. J428 TaxID=2898440 RepID=UPI002151548E|nr:methyltransferase domain-containing protein [Mesorhizobium sp. J428]MCR5855355.1 methyltransferase domain-containing protein [Mesorhizobium sp. J428]
MAVTETHAALMDDVYRWQRHVYDLTRKYYLLGRDRMIDRLDAGPGTTVLELGCGTGRNLALATRRHRQAQLFGLDISAQMLETAQASLTRAGLGDKVRLAEADATDFDPQALFGRAAFDRVYISYSLSMIPDWKRCVSQAMRVLAPGGSLHIVDFGRQERLPGWFRAALRAWLARFHVAPRDDLREVLESISRQTGASLEYESLFRGYAVHAIVGLPR